MKYAFGVAEKVRKAFDCAGTPRRICEVRVILPDALDVVVVKNRLNDGERRGRARATAFVRRLDSGRMG